MKRKYHEAMRAAAREREERQDEAMETRNWFDEWAMSAKPMQQDEQPKNEHHKMENAK